MAAAPPAVSDSVVMRAPTRVFPLPPPTSSRSFEESSVKVNIIVGALLLALLAFGVGASIEHIPVAVKAAHTAYVFSGIYTLIALVTGLYYLRPVTGAPPAATTPYDTRTLASAPPLSHENAVQFFIPHLVRIHSTKTSHDRPLGNPNPFPNAAFLTYFPHTFTVTLDGAPYVFDFSLGAEVFMGHLSDAFNLRFSTETTPTGFTFHAPGMGDPTAVTVYRDSNLPDTLYEHLYNYLLSRTRGTEVKASPPTTLVNQRAGDASDEKRRGAGESKRAAPSTTTALSS